MTSKILFIFRDLQSFNDRKPGENDSDLKAAHQEAEEATKLSNNARIEKYYASGISDSENEEIENNNNIKRKSNKEVEDDKENIKVR